MHVGAPGRAVSQAPFQGKQQGRRRSPPPAARAFFLVPLPNVESYSSSHTLGSVLIMLNSFNLVPCSPGCQAKRPSGAGGEVWTHLSGFSALAAKKKATDMSQASECTATSSSHLK